jgi:LacI family transcriptional regulator
MKNAFNRGYAAAQEILSSPESADCIIGMSDWLALGAMKAAEERGLNCPRDIGIAGYDGLSAAAESVPTLTTVCVNRELLGRLAVRKMARLISNSAEEIADIRVLPELIAGKSTAPAWNRQNRKIPGTWYAAERATQEYGKKSSAER